MNRRFVRVPYSSLYTYLQVRSGLMAFSRTTNSGYGIPELARSCGVTKRTAQRWATAGGLTLDSADEVACRLGTHASVIWRQDWWDAVRVERSWVTVFEDDPLDSDIYSVVA